MEETNLILDEDMIGGDGEAEVTAWLVDSGERVDRDQPVVELSTSKAIIEAVAPAAGVLQQLAAVGDAVTAGQPIATITQATA